MPAIPSSLIEPVWDQFAALLPPHQDTHRLGRHRPRIPDRIAFDALVQVLVFGCAYHHIADETVSATTLRRRRDAWIAAGVRDTLFALVLATYERMIGLDLATLAVDGGITKAPCGGDRAAAVPSIAANRAAGARPWSKVPTSPWAWSSLPPPAMTPRCWNQRGTPWTGSAHSRSFPQSISIGATTFPELRPGWPRAGCSRRSHRKASQLPGRRPGGG